MPSTLRRQIMFSTTSKAKKEKIASLDKTSVVDMANNPHIYRQQGGMTEELHEKQLHIHQGLTPIDVAESFGFHLWERHKFDKNRRREAIERAAYVVGFEDHLKDARKEAGDAAKAKYPKGGSKKIEEETNKQFVVIFAKKIGFVHSGATYSSSLDDKVQKILSTQKTIPLVKKFKAAGSLQSAGKVKSLMEPIAIERAAAAQQGKKESKPKHLYEKYHEKASEIADIAMDGLGILGDAVDSNPIGYAANSITFLHGFKKSYHAFKDAAGAREKGDKLGDAITKIDTVIERVTDGLGIFEEVVPGLAMVSGALSSFAAMLKLGAGIHKHGGIKSYMKKIQNGKVEVGTPEEKASAVMRLSMMSDASNKQIADSSVDLLEAVVKITEGIVALGTAASGGPPGVVKMLFGALSIGTKIARKAIMLAMQKHSDNKTAKFIKDRQKHLFESPEYKKLSKREKKIVKRRSLDADSNQELADRVRVTEAIELFNKIQVSLKKPGATGPGLSTVDRDIISLMGYGTADVFLQNLTIEDFVQQFNMEDDNFLERGKTASERRDEFDQEMLDRAHRKKVAARAKFEKKEAKKAAKK